MADVNRREFLGTIGLATGTGLLAGSQRAFGIGPERLVSKDVVWDYVKLNPEHVADEAYNLMLNNGCMYGVFASVFESWKTAKGANVVFPLHMMRYGEGGTGGWGTLCGALNGGAAAMGLFIQAKPQRQKLIAELFSWYESTELPIYQPKESQPMVTSVSESVLCHISVSRWCKKSGQQTNTAVWRERCRCLSADVAAKTVELLNKNLNVTTFPATENHGSKGAIIAKMNCAVCHDE